MMTVKKSERVGLAVRVYNMNDNETRFKVHTLTTCYVVYECVKCGRLIEQYCADPDWNYCDKCGRKIIKVGDDNGNGINHKIHGDIKLRAEVCE